MLTTKHDDAYKQSVSIFLWVNLANRNINNEILFNKMNELSIKLDNESAHRIQLCDQSLWESLA